MAINSWNAVVNLNRRCGEDVFVWVIDFSLSPPCSHVISCGILPTPRFGRKSNFLFTPGSSVSFECNEGFMLVGDQRRTCTNEGRWNLPEHGYTECLREYRKGWELLVVGGGFYLLLSACDGCGWWV